jgi:S1-C subfamily serine protease
MMYSHSPSNGSSGAPIVNKETRRVVGIVRGNEVSHANRKLIGFAIPSECLFEAFKLPGMPDGVE